MRQRERVLFCRWWLPRSRDPGRATALLAPVLALLCGAFQPAVATHFRYGHISWTPGSGNTINFTIQNAWRHNGYTSCVNTTTLTLVPCNGPGGLPAVGDVIHEFIGATTFTPGDGSPPKGSGFGPFLYLVTAIDPANNWLFGLALDPASLPGPPVDTTIEHTYAAPGDYVAAINSCCRISAFLLNNAHINNPDGSYRTETIVNVGTGNRSPSSALPPIVACAINTVCSFLVPGADPNGDPLTFRMATAAEAGSGFRQPGPPFAPNAAAVSPSGLYTWDSTGAALGPPGLRTFYSTQVIITDSDAQGAPKSKVAVDFFIELVDAPPPPPSFDQPQGEPSCGAVLRAFPGQLIRFTVRAFNPDPMRIVTLNAAGLPASATMTPPLPTSGNPVSSMFSWTPTEQQAGTHVLTFEARDNRGLQTLCSITNEVVSAIPVPVDVKPQSCRNPFNVRERGVLPVAILGTSDFDATAVDPESVRLDGIPAIHWSVEDVATPFSPYLGKTQPFDCTSRGPDGFADLTLKFDAQAVAAAIGAVADGEVRVLKLTGNLKPDFGSTSVIGEDVIVVLSK